MSNPFYRTEVREVHFRCDLSAITETTSQDLNDRYDWVVVTVDYMRNGRPSSKTFKIPTEDLVDKW